MAGILRVIVRFTYSKCGVYQQVINKSRRLRTVTSNCALDLSRKSCAYFSSEAKLAINTTMSEKNELFQRLPLNILPHHYDITLRPDLINFKFDGKEYIHITVNETTDTILLNAASLTIKNVNFIGEDETQMFADKYNLDEDKQILTIKFPKLLPAGENGYLNLQFEGILSDNMKGLYKCKHTSPEGETKYAAVTQFQATDARRCFPCWDEPALKATFDITLIVPTGLTALSNMPVKEETVEGDVTTLKFDTSPKMSTYLVAMVVGEFDYVEDKTSNGVTIRVYTPKGKSEQGKFALEVATSTLTYYDKYFGIPYPLPKLDCVAVPDFSAGAMENWGLVIFRESCLLFDHQNTSSVNKQWIGLVVTHELAHQWFGNLVTMKWWTDLWLNEGYATFTEFVCIDKLYPKFNLWKQFVTDHLHKALELDALKNSHPIEVPIHNPEEIDEIFDDISYSKGASVIRMLYSWIGAEDFMTGMNAYLNHYAYSNAETVDLWQFLENSSKKPVSKVMPTWTRQTGYPILSVEQRQQGNDRILTFSQKRFLADGSDDVDDTLWSIPINIATSAKPDEIAMTVLISDRQAEITVPNVPENSWVKVNSGSYGFYRTKYSQDMINALLPSIRDKTLPPLDRHGILDDLFNSAKAGYVSTVEVLKVLEAYKQEDNYIVWNSIATCLSRIHLLISHLPILEQFKAFSRNIYRDICNKVGWEAKPGESHLDILLRNLILNRMVMLQDKETVDEAIKRFSHHLSGHTKIPADLRTFIYCAVVNNGDKNTLNSMLELYDKTELHEEKTRILSTLGLVRDKKLLEQVLHFSISDNVRAQDTIFVFPSTSWSAESRDFTWNFVKDNWTAFKNRTQTANLLLRIVKWTTEDFVTEEKARDIEEFFLANPNPAIDRPAKQSIEKIRLNAEWLKRDKDSIEQFLSSQ